MIKGIIVTALIIFATLIFGGPIFYYFIATPYQVLGFNMKPTLNHKEYTLIEKISYKTGQPKREDIVLYKDPQNKDHLLLGRIIGIPGDRVKISSGFIYLNDSQLPEKYIDESIYTQGDRYQREGEEVKVPEGSYYILSDNREEYMDSRTFGFVKKSTIVGKYWLRYY